MLTITIPGRASYALAHLVLDYNGTLALDGELLPGVGEALVALAGSLELHVVTADTHGSVHRALTGLPCRVVVLDAGAQDEAKCALVESLGAGQCVAIGNGYNDARMLRAAALGIAVLQEEGTAVPALLAADIAVRSIQDALYLLRRPARLIASLRNA